MRHLIYIVMLAGVSVLCGSQGSSTASAPPKAGGRQVEPYIYVSGGVHKPGRYDWTKGMTVIDAIHAAGGFTDPATRKVRIVHFDGASEIYTRDDTNVPPILRAGDRISVPRRVF
jgi:protein involved in polysaccharide export with SLBB domain